MTTPAHLGGHFGITNMDPATLEYLRTRYQVKSMLDVGCGPAGMVGLAQNWGIDALGIDGDQTLTKAHTANSIAHHDYTTGPLVVKRYRGGGWFIPGDSEIERYSAEPPSVDLVWCVEFVEHVEAQYVSNFLATFRCGRVLLLTHAVPGQGGYHHVNEQPASYWMEKLDTDWLLDWESTKWCRWHASNQYTKATGMVFIRRGAT